MARGSSAGWMIVVAAALAVAGCRRDGRVTEEIAGEISTTWAPSSVEEIVGVPTTAVASAIAGRLAGERPAGVRESRWTQVRALYELHPGLPLWLGERGPDEARVRALVAALRDAPTEGLRADAYRVPELTRALGGVRGRRPTAASLAEVDVLLTTAYVAYADDLLFGQTNPRTLSQDWHVGVRGELADSALVRFFHAPRLDDGLARLRPAGADYEALRGALRQYRELVARGGWASVPAGRNLAPGDTDATPRLIALRRRLGAESLKVSEAQGEVMPGRGLYEPDLAGAVATFQAHHGIVVDSVLGKETVDALNVPAAYRLGQITANLERFRWLPRSFGDRYILVNVPAFRVEVFDAGRRVLEMKTIVGAEYEGRRTPVFADSMEYVVFRPYWNVTPDIQRLELEPKIAADPEYMERNDYEYWMDGGQERIRQKPGPKNSLGNIKFMFPNDFNIYLHDTPEGALFAKDVRAFSHGCIRLEKPAELAQWVLGWSAERVEKAMEEGRDNSSVKLPRKIPVYVTYFTTYTNDGQLHFGNDLYSRDEKLVEAVR